ncbi:Zn-dependent protease with chaperone function [Pseudomonas duriflava]|uniref:Zn-dependent protease with chaperone function n=1 Tax=Pseudomonas duriflava TaxID=459528 RepID=A0A562QKE0_9PSED|nr:M48 family metallopeptidase [Pseudomonas duriflava]TWI56660.1 Zn-dependent protease with chaperone function [Pseudomonas duriflava]
MSRNDLAIGTEALSSRAPHELASDLLKQIGLNDNPPDSSASSAKHTQTPVSAIASSSEPSLVNETRSTSGTWIQTLHLIGVTICCMLIILTYLTIVVSLAGTLAVLLPQLDLQTLIGHPLNEGLIIAIKSGLGLVGTTLLFFLGKALLPRKKYAKPAVIIDRLQEQRLWDMLIPLCKTIQAPLPLVVHLNNEVDARVSLAPGWQGLIKGELMITLGLPLVAGLDNRQLQGVLAHELGHCTRRLSMRCYFIINACNAWLDQRAHFHDTWSERLHRLSETDVSRFTRLGVMLARAGMRIPKQLIHYLFLLSYRLSRPVCRLLEFEADRYSAQVSGSATFRATTLHLHALRWAFRQADRQNASTWSEGALLSDMSHATAVGATRLDIETQRKLEAKLRDRQRYWRAHPADLERINRVEALSAPGYIDNSQPAAALFDYFQEYCRQATAAYYQRLGLDVSIIQLRETSHAALPEHERSSDASSLTKWTLGQWCELPWLPLHEPVERALGSLDWASNIDELRRRSTEIGSSWQQAQKEVQRRVMLACCEELAAHHITHQIHGTETFNADHYLDEYRGIVSWQSPARLVMSEAAALFRQRIEYALKTCHLGHARARELAQALFALCELYPSYERLREAHKLVKEYNSLSRLQISREVSQLSHYALLDFRSEALKLLQAADKVPQQLLEGESIGGYLRLQCPYLNGEMVAPLEFYQKSDALLEGFAHCYHQIFNALSTWCLSVEAACLIRTGSMLNKQESKVNPI